MPEQCTQYVESTIGGGFADGISRFCSLRASEVLGVYAVEYCKTIKCKTCPDLRENFTPSQIEQMFASSLDSAQSQAKYKDSGEIPLPCQVCLRKNKYEQCPDRNNCHALDGDHAGLNISPKDSSLDSPEQMAERGKLYRLRHPEFGGSCSSSARD